MTQYWEISGQKPDPIDDVCYQLHVFYTQNYRTPGNGEWLRDDYVRIIDLTTQPTPLSEIETAQLNRSIGRHNQHADGIVKMLSPQLFEDVALMDAYIGVMAQVNAINAADPLRTEIAYVDMGEPLLPEEA